MQPWKSNKCTHTGVTPVQVGAYTVRLAACSSIDEALLKKVDIILPLNGYLPHGAPGTSLKIMLCELVDRGGVFPTWETFIKDVIKQLKAGKNILAYCTGSHGRTGTFGASLIALLEPKVDPIDTIRTRHCLEAVETYKQAKAIYALRNQKPPQEYKEEFITEPAKFTAYSGKFSEQDTLGSWSDYKTGACKPLCLCPQCLALFSDIHFEMPTCCCRLCTLLSRMNARGVLPPRERGHNNTCMCTKCWWVTEKHPKACICEECVGLNLRGVAEEIV